MFPFPSWTVSWSRQALTATVLDRDGVAVESRSAQFAGGSGRVVEAQHALPRHRVTRGRVGRVNVAAALARLAAAANHVGLAKVARITAAWKTGFFI